MAKRKLLLFLMLTTTLSGCTFLDSLSETSTVPSDTTTSLSEESGSDTISETLSLSEESSLSDVSITTEAPSSSVDVPSTTDTPSVSLPPASSEEGEIVETPPVFDAISAADLTNFRTDIVNDPAIPYKDNDYTVKPFPNGFTYPDGVRLAPTNAYLEFWHPETSLDFRIIASNDIFMKIQENGLNHNKELYWPVTLQVKMNEKTFTYYEVGARMKGNTSRRKFVDHNGEFYDNVNLKLSFNELWTKDVYAPFNLQKTWTKENNPEWTIRDERTFMGRAKDNEKGMKKLDLKWNKSKDDSLVMQPFVFSFFQKHGVMTQNSTLATLKYNDTRMGIVTVNEPINKHLFRRYLPTAGTDGALYKVGWGFGEMGSLRIEHYNNNNRVIGEEDKFTGYEPTYDRKEGPADDAVLINLMQVLKDNEGKTPAQYSAALEAVVDMDSFLIYAALSYLTGNPDDMRNNGNNYYIYFNPAENNKAYFIPYDYDWSMGLMWDNMMVMFGVSPLSTKHKGNDDSWQKNRLYWYTMLESNDNGRNPRYNITMNRDYQNSYIAKVKAFNNDPHYSVDGYNAVYEMYRATYKMKSGSDLDSIEDGLISPFAGTALATSFISDVKQQINHYL